MDLTKKEAKEAKGCLLLCLKGDTQWSSLSLALSLGPEKIALFWRHCICPQLDEPITTRALCEESVTARLPCYIGIYSLSSRHVAAYRLRGIMYKFVRAIRSRLRRADGQNESFLRLKHRLRMGYRCRLIMACIRIYISANTGLLVSFLCISNDVAYSNKKKRHTRKYVKPRNACAEGPHNIIRKKNSVHPFSGEYTRRFWFIFMLKGILSTVKLSHKITSCPAFNVPHMKSNARAS